MNKKEFDDGGPMYPSEAVRGVGPTSFVTYFDKGGSVWDYYAGQILAKMAEQYMILLISESVDDLLAGQFNARSATDWMLAADAAGLAADAMIAEKRKREKGI